MFLLIMEIKGKIYCFFEQSGTFKTQFRKLGYKAEDYDIQNEYGETDHICDLFAEIEQGYDGKPSIFDEITTDDLVLAFYPCIYFESLSMMNFSWTATNYRKKTKLEALDLILERTKKRYEMYCRLLKLCGIVTAKKIPLIVENPWSMQHYLKQGNFLQPPSIIDNDRSKRGDKFIKPTAYWFFNCEPEHGFTYQPTPAKNVLDFPGAKNGICSKERSEITPDYARNFICDFILGKKQQIGQLSLF